MARKTVKRAPASPTNSIDVKPSPANLPPARTRSPWLTVGAIAIFVLVFGMITITSFQQKSPTVDEPVHLLSGYSYLKWGDYRTNPEHPPLAKMWAALPLLALDIKDTRHLIVNWELISQFSPHALHVDRVAGETLFSQNDAERLFFYAKLQMIMLAMLLGVFVYRWSAELFGVPAGLAALFIYCLDPNILAHSQFVHTDIAFTATFFIGSYFFWGALSTLNWRNFLLTTLFFALASVTKYAYIAMLLVWTVLGVRRAINDQPLRVEFGLTRLVSSRAKKAGLIAGILCGSLVAAYFMIWCVYGFRYDAIPGGVNHLPMASEWPANPYLQSFVSFLIDYRLFPEAWIYGQLFVLKNLQREAYLLGWYSDHGFVLYFPVAFAVKTPLPTLLLVCAMVGLWLAKKLDRSSVTFLAVPVVIYFLLGMVSRINIGLRHVLPIYPFLFVLLGGAAASLWQARQRYFKYGLTALGLWLLWSCLSTYPHYLSYFNELAGGPTNGHKVLLDSNLDWGQDLKGLKRWMDRNGVKKIQFLYFGFHDAAAPLYYGIDAIHLPGGWVNSDSATGSNTQASDYLAISANHLFGDYFLRGERRADFVKPFRTLRPRAVIGYSIYVFQVSDAITQLRRVIEVNPNSGAARADLGSLLENQGQLAEAVEQYRQAISLDPRNTKAHYNWGIILGKQGQWEEATKHLISASDASPKDADIRYDLAVSFAVRGELEKAVEQFWATLKIDPNYTKAHYNLGVVLTQLGRLDEAIERFRDTLNIDPLVTKAHFQLGVLFSNRGANDLAERHLRQAVLIEPNFAEAHERLGRLLLAQGKKDEAIKHLETALELVKSRPPGVVAQ